MAETFGRFAAVPIGPLLAARDSGLALATTGAANINRAARSDVVRDSGTAGVEFAVWGDDDMAAVVGAVNASASLSAVLGGAGSIGWNLAVGSLRINGTTVKTGLAAAAKGDMVGVLVIFGAQMTVRLYRNGQLVHEATAATLGPLYFAASLAATKAGGLPCTSTRASGWPTALLLQLAGRCSRLPVLPLGSQTTIS